MQYECIALNVENGIAHLVLNRPATLNTMHPVLWRELEHAFAHLQKSGDARVLVLSSTGKHFSAGMSLDVFAGAIAPPMQDASAAVRFFYELRQMQEVFDQCEELRIPVIAAIQGGAIGAGLDLACACDIRLASEDAFFCIQEINIGMAADMGTLQRLPKLIPEGVARELAYTGRRLPAARAQAIGLVNEIFPTHEALLAGAMAMAREIAEKPPTAVWGSKQAIQYARDHSTADALQQMGWLQAAIWQTADLHEAFKAKQESRAPRYSDHATVHPFSEQPYKLK